MGCNRTLSAEQGTQLSARILRHHPKRKVRHNVPEPRRAIPEGSEEQRKEGAVGALSRGPRSYHTETKSAVSAARHQSPHAVEPRQRSCPRPALPEGRSSLLEIQVG